jgi:hypothetical protein
VEGSNGLLGGAFRSDTGDGATVVRMAGVGEASKEGAGSRGRVVDVGEKTAWRAAGVRSASSKGEGKGFLHSSGEKKA